MRLTTDRKNMFLAELARHGIKARAARAASPNASQRYGALQTFLDERERDPDFAAEWDSAMELARADVEHELYRRGQEGWEEPIYGGRFREQIVGTVRRYSDRLLELRARALLPAYRDTNSSRAEGTIMHQHDVSVLSNAVVVVAEQLAQSFEQQVRPGIIEAKVLP